MLLCWKQAGKSHRCCMICGGKGIVGVKEGVGCRGGGGGECVGCWGAFV